jgi:hypothetical protein
LIEETKEKARAEALAEFVAEQKRIEDEKRRK